MHAALIWLLLFISGLTFAAPDEEALGKSRGYPIGTPETFFYDQSVRVGSFSNIDKIRFRPDTQQQVIPKDYLIEATDWHAHPTAFHPRVATPYHGYGYQFWIFPSEKRRYALLGVYGQMIFVDPELKLVMVQTTANATARAGGTTLAREADALWRGLVAHYGRWD